MQMDTDLVLAIAHHLAVFTLVGILAAEFALIRPGLPNHRIQPLAQLDMAYGAIAGVVIAIGVLRIMFGAAGWQYYVTNYAFWGKMAAFVAIALCSLPPTAAIRHWHGQHRTDPGFVPPAADIIRMRRFLHAQLGILSLVLIFAAMMARGYGST